MFLHGNVRIGYCESHKVAGLSGMRCQKCGMTYRRSPLLYPIKKKNYAQNQFIASQWNQLKRGFQKAFMITIIGYSGLEMWRRSNQRNETSMGWQKSGVRWNRLPLLRFIMKTRFLRIGRHSYTSLRNWRGFFIVHGLPIALGKLERLDGISISKQNFFRITLFQRKWISLNCESGLLNIKPPKKNISKHFRQ